MFNFSSFPLPAALARTLLALLFLPWYLPAAAQAPAWQSARAVAVATAVATDDYSEVAATAVDAAGNVFLVGTFKHTVVLGNTTLTSLGGGDVFVAKYNPASHQFLWAQRAGGTDDDVATALAVGPAGVYVAGAFDSPTAGFGPAILTNVGTSDVFVAKLTDAGNTGSFVWARQAGGTEYDEARALAVNGSNVYVAGQFASPAAGFGPTTLTPATANYYDVFVAKLTDAGSTGSFVWAQRAGGSGSDYANALAVSGTSVYVGGSFTSPTAGFGSATLTNANAATFDVFVAKMTDEGSTGRFAWAQRAGGSELDNGFALAVSGQRVFVAGRFVSPTADFGPLTLANPTPNSAIGFLASLTDLTLTATTAPTGPREPAALFPNPAHHTATLRLPAGTAPAPLVLTDALGRAVRRYPAPAGPEAALDLSGLPAGLYLLRGAGPAQRLLVE